MTLLAPDHAQHTMIYTHTGDPDPYMVTFGTRWTSGTETLATLTAAVQAVWITRVMPHHDANLVLTRTVSIGMDTGGTEFTAEDPSTQAGTGGGTHMPPNVALLVRKTSQLRGRRNRGRMYLPMILGDGEVDDLGNITAGRVSSLQTAFDNVLLDLDGRSPDSNMVILHSSAPTTPTTVFTLVVDPLVATQRRRLR